MLTLAVMLFFGGIVAYTGPAFEEGRDRRRRAKDWPKARIKPIRACQVCQRVQCPWHC
jgi:hypothetical protein